MSPGKGREKLSISHLLNATATVYRSTPAATYPHDDVWALYSTIGIRKSVENRRELIQDGTIKYISGEIALVHPSADVKIADRLYIGTDMYDVKSYEDVDGMGLEVYLLLDKMPAGTKAGMGV